MSPDTLHWMVCTCVEKWCMTAMDMQASQEAVRRGTLRASETNAWKPLSAQICTRALLRSQPTCGEKRHTNTLKKQQHRHIDLTTCVTE